MSIKLGTRVREDSSLLKQSVLLALELNWDINTMNKIPVHTYSEFYTICERNSSEN